MLDKALQQTNKLNHLAIIMDGNGRWAHKRGLERTYGHIQGVRTAKNIIAYCLELNIRYLTLYAFSSENWLRPKKEVDDIMFLLETYLEEELDNLIKNEVRLVAIGDIHKLSEKIKKSLTDVMEKTSSYNKLTIYLAISYGSHDEMVYATKQIAQKVLTKELSVEQITKNTIDENLYARFDVFPELLIRTSGEKRLSNFLLYQSSYCELYFTNILWPDFRRKDLDVAIENFVERKRRFGNL